MLQFSSANCVIQVVELVQEWLSFSVWLVFQANFWIILQISAKPSAKSKKMDLFSTLLIVFRTVPNFLLFRMKSQDFVSTSVTIQFPDSIEITPDAKIVLLLTSN